ncbi:hypothetical protein GJ744_004010 [Endocarpon pusillum]|uniref:Uncharacterized protein n=1 Tax=Endocarpon pusillum TaxID=364733 RepID=A0A8H7A711_9EURO|nr:hypothetical protein GJ744_004010 [Endocarpon pusillum]
MADDPTGNLRSQWRNPGDILSLLLLIGGDIVQKAIAQLVGYTIEPFGKHTLSIGVTPIAFSFGWVAYGFTNLLSAVGEKRLMPPVDCPSIIVNCSNAFIRENRSWALGRLLRDHETRHEVDSTNPPNGQLPSTLPQGRAESIRIDIFELGALSKPKLDSVWWFGWVTIFTQIGIASIPWILYNNWEIIIIVLCGNFLAFFTCAMPQWRQEKWAGRTLDSEKVVCLTRGNGHLHVMVFIGSKGSWDLETLATASTTPRLETPIISLALAVLWTCLLISVAGIRKHAWYLVAIGCIGMLQNVTAAGIARDPGTSNFHLTKFARMPTIIGKRQRPKDDMNCSVDLERAQEDVSELSEWLQSSKQRMRSEDIQMPKWLHSMARKDGVPAWLVPLRDEPNEIANTHGALKELEKWVPTAGLAMVQVFFPTSLRYDDSTVRDNIDKKFWKRAYHTQGIRKRAEHERRKVESGYKAKDDNGVQGAFGNQSEV